MGYSLNLFTNPDIDEEFQCSICHDVLQDPRILNPCEHQFCYTCIVEWRKKSTCCPCCRSQPVTRITPHRPFLKLLNKLELRCPYAENGCKTVMRLDQVPDHDLRCEFNPANQKECEGGCGAVLNQFVRKTGTHSCVDYLNCQWQITKQVLWFAELKLQESEELREQNKNSSCVREAKLAESEQCLQETKENLKSTDLQLRETQAKLASAEAKLQKAEVKLKSLEEQSKEMREMRPKFQQQMNKGFGLSDTESEEEDDLNEEEEEGEDYGEFRGDEQEGEGEEGNVEEGGEVEEGNVEGGEVEGGEVEGGDCFKNS